MPTPLDVAVREQAYIEGVKNFGQDGFDLYNTIMSAVIVSLLASYRYDKISDMPKSVLRKFASELNEKITKINDKFTKEFNLELITIAGALATVTALNLSALSGKSLPDLSGTKATDLATNEIIPGSGHLPRELIKDFVRSVKNQIALTIKRAFVEKWTATQLNQAINGTKARNYKDGLTNKFANQFNTVQQTLIQHIAQRIKHALSRLVYSHYQWVAVLDSSTTEICRGRHGHVYAYGAGPIPPAHYNCRSTIAGINGIIAYPDPASYFDWIKAQPTAVQNDLLGESRARSLRRGEYTAKDVPKFDGTKKISPKDLIKYQPTMIG
jgi:SPP1 gp7 family putative phage head morphogenesis protein